VVCGQRSRLWTRAHARKLPQVLLRQLPFFTLGREFDEHSVKGTPSCLHHLGVVEVPDAQEDGCLETYGPTDDLKGDTNLRASSSSLDASHCDPEFTHPSSRRPMSFEDVGAPRASLRGSSSSLGASHRPDGVENLGRHPLTSPCSADASKERSDNVRARIFSHLAASYAAHALRMTCPASRVSSGAASADNGCRKQVGSSQRMRRSQPRNPQ
jgi:hypothetical protein